MTREGLAYGLCVVAMLALAGLFLAIAGPRGLDRVLCDFTGRPEICKRLH